MRSGEGLAPRRCNNRTDMIDWPNPITAQKTVLIKANIKLQIEGYFLIGGQQQIS